VVELSKSKAEDTAKDRSVRARAQFGPTEYWSLTRKLDAAVSPSVATSVHIRIWKHPHLKLFCSYRAISQSRCKASKKLSQNICSSQSGPSSQVPLRTKVHMPEWLDRPEVCIRISSTFRPEYASSFTHLQME
jgi:hypothetical protein